MATRGTGLEDSEYVSDRQELLTGNQGLLSKGNHHLSLLTDHCRVDFLVACISNTYINHTKYVSTLKLLEEKPNSD